jgi:hypothetical protein
VEIIAKLMQEKGWIMKFAGITRYDLNIIGHSIQSSKACENVIF